MNEEILKLAYSLNFLVIKQGVASLTEEHLVTFYTAAFNAGIEAAAKVLGKGVCAKDCIKAITALEMK